jgi:hypothetical protein
VTKVFLHCRHGRISSQITKFTEGCVKRTILAGGPNLCCCWPPFYFPQIEDEHQTWWYNQQYLKSLLTPTASTLQVPSLIYFKTRCRVDAVENMEKARTIGVSAFAIFFIAVAPQKAHWYNLMTPSTSDASRADINAVFPPLSLLLNLDKTTMEKVLEACSLSWRKGDKSFPTLQAWENIIADYKLDIEVTTFIIASKWHYFVRIGLFDASRHPAKMPIHYWRDRNNNKVSPPKLQINKITTIFGEGAGSMGILCNDLLSNNADNVVENIGIDSDTELVVPRIEQPIEIKRKSMVSVSFFDIT